MFFFTAGVFPVDLIKEFRERDPESMADQRKCGDRRTGSAGENIIQAGVGEIGFLGKLVQ